MLIYFNVCSTVSEMDDFLLSVFNNSLLQSSCHLYLTYFALNSQHEVKKAIEDTFSALKFIQL